MKEKIIGSRYKVIKYIAQGGFGTTYLAQDTQLPEQDLCVVKQLSPGAETPKLLKVARRLFKTEASTLHNLGHHEQIPELLAYFEEQEKFYLVQQYIKGQTIEQEFNSQAVWSEIEVIKLLQDCLKILDFIHRKRVIHRDLKPANLIRRHGDQQIVLVDFGTVKNILQEHPKNSQLTVAVGTKGYMPPEQARGIPRPTSDLYALGIIAIQALTKVEPLTLEEDDHGELIWSHLAQVNPGLTKILNQMTRYDFQDRYQSAAEVLQALNALSDAGKTKSQSPITINQSLSADSKKNYATTAAVSETFKPKSVAPVVSPKSNLSSQTESNPNKQYVSFPKLTPDINLKSVSKTASPRSGKQKASQNKHKISYVNLAIALGAIIIGSIYFLTQQHTPKSSPIPDSETPRLNQGEGFRNDL